VLATAFGASLDTAWAAMTDEIFGNTGGLSTP
jgi:hypothetical protein